MGESMPSSDRAQERRRAPRLKIFQPAELHRQGERARVHLLNISTGGALVYGQAPAEVGEAVRLSCGVPTGTARVAWRSGRRFGIAFDVPIAPLRLEQIMRAQETLIAAASRRLQPAC
jgi:hypothetical protein